VRDLKAFALGAVAVGVLAYAGISALAVSAQAAGRSLAIGLGPFVVVSVEHEASAAVTTFGSGLIVIAIMGGLANVGAAQLIRRRARRIE
jgi:hypothetical protein